MKNTKKYLSTGIALAIALFAAIQVTAMEPNRTGKPSKSQRIRQRASTIRDRNPCRAS